MRNSRLQKRVDEDSDWSRHSVVNMDSRRIRRISSFVIACWFFLSPAIALSLNEETAEYPVKLAFLFNFTKFVEWPPDSYRDPGAPLAICIVGSDPFSPDLEEELRTRKVGNHPVEVNRLRPNDTLSVCHIVFVPVTEKDRAARIVKSLKGSSALTVGETEGFALQGGIINLTVEYNTLHFEVNPLAAARAGLKISSKLLSMAKIVKEQDQRTNSSLILKLHRE
jgi:hypothetical protein